MIAQMLKSIISVSASDFTWAAERQQRRLSDRKVTFFGPLLASAQTISRARQQMETHDPMVNLLCARS